MEEDLIYQQEQKLKVKGVFSSPNQFSEVPEGALSRAVNVVLTRDSVLTTRRGYAQYNEALASAPTSLFNYADTILEYGDNTLAYDDGSGGWTAYAGTFEVPDDTQVGSRVRSFQSNKNFYLTTREGVFKLDAINTTAIPAGAPPALGGTAALTGSSGFMANDTAVAYRVVWGYRDLNDNLILSAASDRIVVSNSSGGTRDVVVTFTVPFSTYITTDWFYQLYRSDPSATASDIPDDNYQQVFEGNPTSGELTARQVAVTDIIPDELRQAFLYSSRSQEGVLAANYPPPYCKDACSWQNFAFYANTREPHLLPLTLLSVGASLGIQIGDTITFTSGVDTFVITGAAAENAALGQFLVYTSGSVSQNNETTARSICAVINLYASNTFLNANYVSNFDDLQGQMEFTKRTIDSANFTVVSSRTTCWSPTIPSSGSTSANTSTNNTYPNRVYVSKLQQPEAVPITQNFDIGSAREPIVRIIPNRDAVFIFKTDGVYSITGDNPSNFRVNVLDNTAIVVAPNSVVTLANSVYYYSQQGVCSINPSGSAVILSNPIEKDLLALSSSNYPNFPELTFGVGYESERTYVLSTISTNSDTQCTQQWLWNDNTKSWTQSDRRNTCGMVNPTDNKLYFGGELNSEGYVFQERKTLTSQDFADEEYTTTIVSSDGLELVLSDLDNVAVDMTIVQGGVSSRIESIDEDTNTITVTDLDTWEAGAAILYTPIETIVTTVPITGGSPGVMKQTAEVSLFFESPNFEEINVDFMSDYQVNAGEVVLTPSTGQGWGEEGWGDQPWGGSMGSSLERLRTLVPKRAQRNNWLIMSIWTNECFISFALEGFSTLSNYQGHRQKK